MSDTTSPAGGSASDDGPGSGPSRTPRRRPRPARDLGGYRAFADAEPDKHGQPAGTPVVNGVHDVGQCLTPTTVPLLPEADVQATESTWERHGAVLVHHLREHVEFLLDHAGGSARSTGEPRGRSRHGTGTYPLLDAVVSDAYVERLALDAQLNKIGELGPARSGIVVHRQVLRHLLLTRLTVHTGAALTGYDVLDNGQVEARFAQRNPATADLLVGADGVGSAVRQVLTPQTTPPDTGVRFVIGRTPLTEQFAGLSQPYGGKTRDTFPPSSAGPASRPTSTSEGVAPPIASVIVSRTSRHSPGSLVP